MNPITDPELIAQLEGSSAQTGVQPVTDPSLLAILEGDAPVQSEPISEPAAVQSAPVKTKGILASAVDTFIGAGARMAQGVNESLGSIIKTFGGDQGAESYKEGAEYWGKKAEEAGSTGLPAKIYEGIGAAPAGIAEFMANVPYAGAKGGMTGYQENGVTGALQGAVIEIAKRAGIGKIFHAIGDTAISGLPKAAAMGGTMGVQTAAEQAMTDEGIQPQDVAASAIIGTMLSINGAGGKSEAVRQRLIRAGAEPKIANDLASRMQDIPSGRFSFVDEPTDQTEPTRPPITVTDPQGRPLDVPIDARPPESIGPLVSETGNGAVRFVVPDTTLDQQRAPEAQIPATAPTEPKAPASNLVEVKGATDVPADILPEVPKAGPGEVDGLQVGVSEVQGGVSRVGSDNLESGGKVDGSVQPVRQEVSGETPEMSAVRNETVEPYVATLYRGTADRDALHDGGMGKGIYYTSDEVIAKSYAEDFSDKPGQVTAHEVTLKKPFYAETVDDVFNVLPEAERNVFQPKEGESINDLGRRQQKQITDILADQGYDGIVLRNSLNPRTGEYVKADEVVVFPAKLNAEGAQDSSQSVPPPETKIKQIDQTPVTPTVESVNTPAVQDAAPVQPGDTKSAAIEGNGENKRNIVNIKIDPKLEKLPLADFAYRAKNIARNLFAGKTVTNKADGSEILIPWQGIKHAFAGKVSRNTAAVSLKLDELIKNAEPTSEALPDNRERKNVLAAYYYRTDAIVNDEPATVKIIVREHLDGRRYYDHYEIENPAGQSGESLPSKEGQGSIQPYTGSSNDSIIDTSSTDVKPEIKTMWKTRTAIPDAETPYHSSETLSRNLPQDEAVITPNTTDVNTAPLLTKKTPLEQAVHEVENLDLWEQSPLTADGKQRLLTAVDEIAGRHGIPSKKLREEALWLPSRQNKKGTDTDGMPMAERKYGKGNEDGGSSVTTGASGEVRDVTPDAKVTEGEQSSFPQNIKLETDITDGADTRPVFIKPLGIKHTEVKTAIDPFLKNWKDAPETHVFQSSDKMPEDFKNEIREAYEDQYDDVMNRLEGGFHDGKLYLIADNLPTQDFAVKKFFHEAVGHFGLRKLLGKKLDPILRQVIKVYGKKGLQDIADRYRMDWSREADRMEAAEEKLAEMAETNEKPAFVTRVMALAKEHLTKLGADVSWSEPELKALVARAKGWKDRAVSPVVSAQRDFVVKPKAGNIAADMPSSETARQAAAETLNSVYPEGSPDIGLAVKPAPKRNDVVIGTPTVHADKKGNFKSADDQVEARYRAANGLDKGPGFLDRTRTFMHKMLSETQHFPELPNVSFADKRTADILRRFESSAVAVKAKTAEHLHGLTATFGPKKMDIFTRKVILDDLMNETDKGRDLPFGYAPEALQKDHAAITEIVDANPDIKAAIKRRADVNTALVMELVDNDLLPVESVLKPEALERFQKTGEYSPEDINTGYFRHQVLEHANARKWVGISTSGEVRNKKRGWQKERQGSEKDINTNFLEAEFEVFSQSLKELATKKTLDEVLRLNDIAPELKAQAKKEGIDDWKTLIPEGHSAWQPEKGSVFYRGQTMPEQIISKFIEENPAFAEVAGKFREATILGGKKAEVIIPEGLAKTLDALRSGREETTLDTVNKKLIGGWKVWTLLSPHRALKYNLNNMSGDMDAAIAADPAILKHLGTSWKNALNRKAGRAMSKNEVDMLDRGVIDSGISINEIPDINKLPGFQRLSDVDRKTKLYTAIKSGNISALTPPNIIAKYFDTISGLSQMREWLLREAAYLRAKELLEQDKKVYWASKPAEIDALPDIKDKAAKLSRELFGDYGNLSAHGEKIRTSFIPFWSWMEINAPRYYRIFKNAALQGEGGSTAARMAGVGMRKVAGAALGVAEKVFLAQVLFAAVSAFNHLVHPDEEEALGENGRKQLHVILGSTSDGKVLSVRFQGAFSDALAWFGLEDWPSTWDKLQNDKIDSGDLAKKMLMATPNKLVNATSPFFKLGAELITGKSLYPDITKPVPIRDKVEHAARFLSLDEEYKAMAGKPSRGYLDSFKKTLLYESDPGEQAYNNIRQQAVKFLEKNGKEMVSGEPTKRSNALYYYRQALRYADIEAADKYKEEYFALGGTYKDMANSVRKAAPLAMIPKNLKYEFRESLSAADQETLTRALEWYQQVYGN